MSKGALSALLNQRIVVDHGVECEPGLCSWESLLTYPMLGSILSALGLHAGVGFEVECVHGSCPGFYSEKSLSGSSVLMERGVLGLQQYGEAECAHGSCHRGCES